MWSLHQKNDWKELDLLQEAPIVGRRLDAGGFIMADPFDVFLRNISEKYLSQTWERLSNTLRKYEVELPGDLSWGWLHPGETWIPDFSKASPLDLTGWTSRQLENFDYDSRYWEIDAELKNGSPPLRCGVTWRSHKWRIPPNDFQMALKLIEAHCTDELTAWSPYNDEVLNGQEDVEPWRKIARAILDDNQKRFNEAMLEAQAVYSPVGYRIVKRAYRAYLEYCTINADGTRSTNVYLTD